MKYGTAEVGDRSTTFGGVEVSVGTAIRASHLENVSVESKSSAD